MEVSLIISMVLFSLGLIGLLVKRNAFILFLSIELMLNAANLLFVTFAFQWNDQTGLVWVFFILTISAIEAAVGLAIMINLFRSREVIDIDQFNLLRE